MELRKATQSQVQTTRNVNSSDYVPLHPGTRSWEVPRENVIIEKIIGSGKFGQVAQGKASQLRGRNEATKVAIKMLKGNHHRFLLQNWRSNPRILWSPATLHFYVSLTTIVLEASLCHKYIGPERNTL